MANSESLKRSNPDHGGTIRETEHKFDKGYMSDDEYAELGGKFPERGMRGNEYLKMQNEIIKRDSKKIVNDKFSKIA